MDLSMYIVGFLIFSSYLVFLVWNINYGSRKQDEEN
jgi:hypothetical protein